MMEERIAQFREFYAFLEDLFYHSGSRNAVVIDLLTATELAICNLEEEANRNE